MRVRKTQNISHRQIENMVTNLQTKFGAGANIQTISRNGTRFWISNGDGFSGWLDKWSDLQVVYLEVMRRKSYKGA